MTASTDEIDLFALLVKAIQFLKKNLLIFIAALSIGIALGLTFYLISPKIYESKLMISSDILTESYTKALVDNIDRLIKEENANTLSRELGLSAEQASAIVKIEIKSALEKASDTPESAKMYLTVEVKLKDNSIWPQIQKGIVDYFQYNDFIKIRVEQRRKYINQVIEKIDVELADLEKLKNKIAEDGLTQANKQNLILFDPTTINSKILELNKERINLQNSLETVNSIQIIEGFTVFNKPTGPKLLVLLAAGASFGLFMAGLIMASKAILLLAQASKE